MPPSDEAAATAVATNTAAEADKPVSEFERSAYRYIDRALKAEKKLEEKGRTAISKYGVTRAMLADYLNQDSASWDELEDVTEDLAVKILRDRYWMPLAGDKLPPELASAIFDVAIKRGVGEASKMAQRAAVALQPAAIKIDGKLRAGSLTAIDKLVEAGRSIELAERVLAERSSIIGVVMDRLFHGGTKFDLAGAAVAVGRAYVLSKTGVRL